jgi:hypothetical protein
MKKQETSIGGGNFEDDGRVRLGSREFCRLYVANPRVEFYINRMLSDKKRTVEEWLKIAKEQNLEIKDI